jgi:hypothetical protein
LICCHKKKNNNKKSADILIDISVTYSSNKGKAIVGKRIHRNKFFKRFEFLEVFLFLEREREQRGNELGKIF